MDNASAKILSPEREMLISFEASQGQEVRASVVRLTRQRVVFEVYDVRLPLRVSEVFASFKIALGTTPVYSGRAVLSNVISTGTMLVCEADVTDGWLDLDIASLATRTHE